MSSSKEPTKPRYYRDKDGFYVKRIGWSGWFRLTPDGSWVCHSVGYITNLTPIFIMTQKIHRDLFLAEL